MEQARLSAARGVPEPAMAGRIDGIRHQLGTLAEAPGRTRAAPAAAAFGAPPSEADILLLLKLRRRRDCFFAAELFADPAWDILLELYAAQLGQRRIPVSSTCIGAAVPTTTALRWISSLEENRLIERRDDPIDGRRVFLSLTSEALAAMDAYFATVPGGSRPI